MTDLAARVFDLLVSSSVPLGANEIGHRLSASVAEVLIALYELEQAEAVKGTFRGLKGRRYYEVA